MTLILPMSIYLIEDYIQLRTTRCLTECNPIYVSPPSCTSTVKSNKFQTTIRPSDAHSTEEGGDTVVCTPTARTRSYNNPNHVIRPTDPPYLNGLNLEFLTTSTQRIIPECRTTRGNPILEHVV